ncbi:MAG: hypothetical protein GY858_04625 [Candidatus Omnitrophica bacterium]|nr:hypothetical protein [Candidatus Omnitrophota bacterium]
MIIKLKRARVSLELISVGLVICMIAGVVFSQMTKRAVRVKTDPVAAKSAQSSIYNLPPTNQLVEVSSNKSVGPVLKGITVNQNNPFELEFTIDLGDASDISEEEAAKLVEYFFAAITIPEEDLWVNLSPHEEDRVISDNLSFTQMGKDLLGEDYILKQLVSSLTYPESDSGKAYWSEIYAELERLTGRNDAAVNTFNKVWIMPEYAKVIENKNRALITHAKLKVMHENDYVAMQHSQTKDHRPKTIDQNQGQVNDLSTQALKEVILPKIEDEVNYGKNFTQLRQIYHSFILAAWFKNKLKDTIFQYYIDQEKIEGVDLADKNVRQNIFNLYVEAYKKGVYDYVKKEPSTHRVVNRRYYSGGAIVNNESTKTDSVGSEEFDEAAAEIPNPRKLPVKFSFVDQQRANAVGALIGEIARILNSETSEVDYAPLKGLIAVALENNISLTDAVDGVSIVDLVNQTFVRLLQIDTGDHGALENFVDAVADSGISFEASASILNYWLSEVFDGRLKGNKAAGDLIRRLESARARLGIARNDEMILTKLSENVGRLHSKRKLDDIFKYLDLADEIELNYPASILKLEFFMEGFVTDIINLTGNLTADIIAVRGDLVEARCRLAERLNYTLHESPAEKQTYRQIVELVEATKGGNFFDQWRPLERLVDAISASDMNFSGYDLEVDSGYDPAKLEEVEPLLKGSIESGFVFFTEDKKWEEAALTLKVAEIIDIPIASADVLTKNFTLLADAGMWPQLQGLAGLAKAADFDFVLGTTETEELISLLSELIRQGYWDRAIYLFVLFEELGLPLPENQMMEEKAVARCLELLSKKEINTSESRDLLVMFRMAERLGTLRANLVKLFFDNFSDLLMLIDEEGWTEYFQEITKQLGIQKVAVAKWFNQQLRDEISKPSTVAGERGLNVIIELIENAKKLKVNLSHVNTVEHFNARFDELLTFMEKKGYYLMNLQPISRLVRIADQAEISISVEGLRGRVLKAYNVFISIKESVHNGPEKVGLLSEMVVLVGDKLLDDLDGNDEETENLNHKLSVQLRKGDIGRVLGGNIFRALAVLDFSASKELETQINTVVSIKVRYESQESKKGNMDLDFLKKNNLEFVLAAKEIGVSFEGSRQVMEDELIDRHASVATNQAIAPLLELAVAMDISLRVDLRMYDLAMGVGTGGQHDSTPLFAMLLRDPMMSASTSVHGSMTWPGPKEMRKIDAGKLRDFEDYLRTLARYISPKEERFISQIVTARFVRLGPQHPRIPIGLPAHFCRMDPDDRSSDLIIFHTAPKNTQLGLDQLFEEASEANGVPHAQVQRTKMIYLKELGFSFYDARQKAERLKGLGLENATTDDVMQLLHGQVALLEDMMEKAERNDEVGEYARKRLKALQSEVKQALPGDTQHAKNIEAFKRVVKSIKLESVGGITLEGELDVDVQNKVEFNVSPELLEAAKNSVGITYSINLE